MSRETRPELQRFLEAYPDTRHFDVFLHDLNTVERGKRLDLAGMEAAYRGGMLLPGSMFALDVLGHTVEATGLGFDDGDADRPCRPIPGTLVPVPWQGAHAAQVQVTMHEPDGRVFYGDPRHVLTGVLQRIEALGLTPVVAIEYEFYFIDLERVDGGLPQPPRGPLTGRREFRTQINAMADLNEYSSVLAQITRDCHAQGVPATSALPEYGPGQYEVNLQHLPDALTACDQALRFKRVVKSVARANGLDATFLPKPYRDMAGSGLHIHLSLLDGEGRNIFACDEPATHAPLRHAVAGLLDSMAEGMAICAPGPNSYRRFRSEAYVPLTTSWSINNRGSAVRIPVSDAANRRIEYRQAGADANPYLVLAWMLAGIHHGLGARIEPPEPLRGNAYAQPAGQPLPTHWETAIERFAGSDFAREYLGERFQRLFATVKRAELADFGSYVTPLECAWYMGPL
ncbi:MAG TPA: glutamine synthetase family protein [Steroidobacteraceae bacterium]|nr:glutamine synthetase family protein [Steroidobacteraceae bacterium]HNS27366.1 glutamine synthetase family protein [Steroidobacteraceae bacterium]